MPTIGHRFDLEFVVENPKGSAHKYEYDENRDILRRSRVIHTSTVFPWDYGFIVDTLAGDGDHLDGFLLGTYPSAPLTLVVCHPLGLFRMRDEKGEDNKVLLAPNDDPDWSQLRTLDDCQHHWLAKLEHFLEVYKQLEPGKYVETVGWMPLDEAIRCIERDRQTLIATPDHPRLKWDSV